MRYMRRVIRLAAAMAFLFPPGAASAIDLAVELPDVIECRGGAFYLGEYAALHGGELAPEVSMAVVTPLDGFFTRDDVIASLGATKAAGCDVALRMPERVLVLPEHPVAERLRAATGWKWRIDVQGLPDGWQDKASNFSLPPKVLPGARAVAVRSERDGRKANKQAKLKWYQPVVYATRDLDRGARLLGEELGVRIDTVGMMRPCAWDPSQISGSVLKESVGEGEAIFLRRVGQLQIVKQGSLVSLSAGVNGLAVSVQGIALERGGIGDTIRVRNLGSKKVVTGTVIDAGRVEIR